MYAVKLMLDELRYGTRPVVTNLPLNLCALNEYIQREWPEKAVDIFARVHLLDDDQTQEFWTYRPLGMDGWLRIPRLTKEQWVNGEKPSYAKVMDSGVWYCIDECHNFFNARAWIETGRDVLFYLSQHRKLGDTVVWVTQAVDNVDKQFRSVTQDFTYLRNLTKEKMGFFKLPAYFVRRTYGEKATPNTPAMETGTFKLDVSGIGSLYDTARGVGIHNRGNADMQERRTGIHWSVLVVGIPALVIAIFVFVPKVTAKVFGSKHHLALPKSGKELSVHPLPSPGDYVSLVSPKVAVSPASTNGVTMIGYLVSPDPRNLLHKRVEVVLSDGRKVRSGDGHLQYLCEDYAVVDGLTNWYHPPVVVAPVESVSVPVPPVAVEVTPPVTTANYGVDSGGVVVYTIPQHVNRLAHPAIRSALGGFNGYGQSGY